MARMGQSAARGLLLDSGPAQGQGGLALGGPLPQGGHEEPVRVEGPAASLRGGRLRHQRAAGGGGGSAGVDAEAGLEVPRAEAGERHLRGLHAAPESAAGAAAEPGADFGGAGRLCKLCGAPVGPGTCEFDHVVPVHQAFRGQIHVPGVPPHQDCFGELPRHHAGEPLQPRRAYQAYVDSPKLPPLVCGLQKWDPDKLCHSIDVVRCRKNGLANDSRMALLSRLPYVGEGWYAKPACAYMLESRRGRTLWSLDATAHVEPACLAWALRRMEEAWGEDEHLAKLSVNALIGLWARNVVQLPLLQRGSVAGQCAYPVRAS